MQTLEMPEDEPPGSHFFSVSLYTITDAFALTIGCSLQQDSHVVSSDCNKDKVRNVNAVELH